MKILFYSHSSTLYGAPSSLANLITGLQRDHPEVKSMVVIPSNGPLFGELKRLNIPCKVIPHYKWNYNHSTFTTKKKQSVIIALLWLVKNIVTRTSKNLFYVGRHLK